MQMKKPKSKFSKGINPKADTKPMEKPRAYSSGLFIPKQGNFKGTPKEMLDLLRKVFRNYCFHNLRHDYEDCKALLEIFDAHICEDNIHNYITRHSKDIYMAIGNQSLEKLADYIETI